MGLSFAKLFSRLFAKMEMKILMVGLDVAGKTTNLYKLNLGEIVTTIPTIGFNVETVEYKDISFTVGGMSGGQDKIRPLRRHYFQNTQGLLFVVDSNDRDRVVEARDELHRMLNEGKLRFQCTRTKSFSTKPMFHFCFLFVAVEYDKLQMFFLFANN